MVNTSENDSGDPRLFPRRRNLNLVFNSDIVNFLLKTNRWSDRRPNFVIFAVWSALIVGGWVVVA